MKKEDKVTNHISSAKTRKEKDFRVCDVAFRKVTERASGKISMSKVTETGTDPVHPDLTKSLKAFLPHFLLLSERANVNEFQPSYFEEEKYFTTSYDYEVTGIHLKEFKSKPYVVIVGRQILKSKRVISMTPPMVCFDPHENDEDVYPFHEELKKALEKYIAEVAEYMTGKFGVPDQTEMDLKAKKEEPEEVVTKTEIKVNEDTSEVVEAPVSEVKDKLDEVIDNIKKPRVVKLNKVEK